jgi:hypothetical protein
LSSISTLVLVQNLTLTGALRECLELILEEVLLPPHLPQFQHIFHLLWNINIICFMVKDLIFPI